MHRFRLGKGFGLAMAAGRRCNLEEPESFRYGTKENGHAIAPDV